MKRAALITATLFVAAFVTSAAQAFDGSDETGEFSLYDASASAPEVPQEVKDLREKAISDTIEQMNRDSKYGGE